MKTRTFTILLILSVGVLAGIAPGRDLAVDPPDNQPDWAKNAPPGAQVTEEGWFAPPKNLQKTTLPDSIDSVFVIPIREPISSKTFKALERKFIRCRGRGADLVVIDMDTWGGEIGAALDISRMLKTDFEDLYVLCYVRTRAVSAGSMIALACDEIVMNPVGKLGDSAPISMQGKIEGVEREKLETVLRTDFKESAERNGYPSALAQCMVSRDLATWLIRHKETGELRYVPDEEWYGNVDFSPGLFDKELKPNTKAKWKIVRIVVSSLRLLTLTPNEAKDFRFASGIIKADPDAPYDNLLESMQIQVPPVVLEDSWSEDLVDLLTHPVVAGILIFLMLMFGYIEMHSPGFGVFGGIAVACLVVLMCSQFLVGLAQWWEIAIFALGVLLLLLEVFVIPGFGIAGISGILLCLVGILAMVIPNAPDQIPWPNTTLDWSFLTNGILSLLGGFIGAAIAAMVLARYLPESTLMTKSKLVLAPAEAAHDAPRPDDSPMLHVQPGDLGTAESMLRPVGEVRFGQDLLDAVSQRGIIEAGQRVRVLRRDGNRIIVEPAGDA